MKQFFVFITCFVLTSTGEAATYAPNDFAYGMPLQLSEDAAIYSLSVPKEIYQYTVRPGLGDLRVFNGAGEWLTYSLSTPAAKTSAAPLVTLPMFPLRGDPARALDRVKITIAAAQGAVNLQTTRNIAPAPIQAYVVDARHVASAITALELHWRDDAPEFSGRMDVERSDDLDNWLLVANNLPVINLNFNGQQLLQNRLAFPAIKTQYLRLRWQAPSAPLALDEIRAESATQIEPVREQAVFAAQPASDQRDAYDFTLDLHAPIDRVNLQLPQPNTLANITLLSRARLDLPWRNVTTLRVYQLHNTGAELRNAAAIIAPNTDRYWRMQVQTGSLGNGVPQLQVGWVPQIITFVARGKGPFELAFGNATTLAATTPINLLLADPNIPISIGKASAGALHKLGGPEQLTIKHEIAWKKWLLWAVLVGAVITLAAVAHRLTRELSK